MSLESDRKLIEFLRQMIQDCKTIQESLKQDLKHFSKNNMDMIHESNAHKMRLVEGLNKLAMDVKACVSSRDSDDLMAALNAYQDNAGSREKAEIMGLRRTLKAEIDKCYQELQTNSKLVYANLDFLKRIWDRLLGSKSDNACVYDQKGVTSK